MNFNLQVRMTKRFIMLKFIILLLGRFRFMGLETAAKTFQKEARKGRLVKYKIDNGEWRSYAFDVDYEVIKS